MYHNVVPSSLHQQAESLIAALDSLNHAASECPYCQQANFRMTDAIRGYYYCKVCHRGFNRGVGTPFYRLAPLAWLPIIAAGRLSGQSYAMISYQLDYCTTSVVKRRVRQIEHYMASHYPELSTWYQDYTHQPPSEIPNNVHDEAEQLKSWVRGLLQGENITCPHCQSDKCTAHHRVRFRCHTCWRYFSNLKGTGLEHFSYSQHWLTIIDMLVAGKTNQAIAQQLHLSSSTVTYARCRWLAIMQQRGLALLHLWVVKQRGY